MASRRWKAFFRPVLGFLEQQSPDAVLAERRQQRVIHQRNRPEPLGTACTRPLVVPRAQPERCQLAPGATRCLWGRWAPGGCCRKRSPPRATTRLVPAATREARRRSWPSILERQRKLHHRRASDDQLNGARAHRRKRCATHPGAFKLGRDPWLSRRLLPNHPSGGADRLPWLIPLPAPGPGGSPLPRDQAHHRGRLAPSRLETGTSQLAATIASRKAC